MNRDAPPTPWVTVDWSLALDANTQALYQQMATLLSSCVAVPPDRANYFAPYLKNIGSCGGMVNNVQGDGCGGRVVTVSVDGFIDQAQLDNDQTGSIPPIIFALYSEIYHVDSLNNLIYVGPSIPDGAPTRVSFGGAA